MSKAKKSLYVRRIEKGLCGLCGGDKADTERSVCDECLTKQKQRYKAHREGGGCFICGKSVTKPGAAYCRKHYDMRMKRRDRRREMGLCYDCGKHPSMSPNKRCEYCFFRNIAKSLESGITGEQLAFMLDSQGRRCSLSGRLLTPGINCHLDHIIPRSKGGGDELANLRWVDKSVNYAKRELTDDDFLRLVVDVYCHAKKEAVNQ